MTQVRNIHYNQFGTIDLEYDHPEFGWIPATVADATGEPDIQELYDQAVAAGVAPYTPPVPTAQMVNRERDQRLTSGFSFVVDGVTHMFDSDDASIKRITGAATLAGFAIGAGAQPGDFLWHGGSTPFGWITRDNQVVQMDAQTTFALGQRAANWESEHVFAAMALKNMSEISADYADDAHWPSA